MDALGRAILESLEQGIAVFDAGGGLVYANPIARRLLAGSNGATEARRALLARQGRAVPLRDGEMTLGEAVLIAGNGATTNGASTLAERERQAIIEALAATGGRLAESARRLGISRTTLWRRLRTYGDVPRPGAAP
jgi:transcriptional regulator of acetoin/glycerol metabolism